MSCSKSLNIVVHATKQSMQAKSKNNSNMCFKRKSKNRRKSESKSKSKSNGKRFESFTTDGAVYE